MGHGIAELAAISGNEVWINDVSQEILQQAMEKIKWSLSKLKSSGSLREDVEQVMSRIHPEVSQPEALKDSNFVIEAVKEDLELKRTIFRNAETYASPTAVLATNTSSLPVTEIGAVLRSKERVVGMHFFNPPVLMPLVEVVKGKDSSDEVVKATVDMAKSMGKETIVVKDVPGFFVNRILLRIMEAGCYLVERGKASFQEVDSSAIEELGFPMGVFLLADYTGLDIGYSVWKAVTARGFKAFPCTSTEKLVSQGMLGVKSGAGYYQYPSPGKFARPNLPKATKKLGRYLISPAVNEVSYLIREGVIGKEEAEKGCILGLGLPKGILSYADEIGLDVIEKTLEEMKEDTGMDHFAPDPLLVSMVREGKLGRKSGGGFHAYKSEEMNFSTIVVKIEPPLGWIILNRPSRYNAINGEMIREIDNALEKLEEKDEVRVIVVTGQGRVFSAGADVTEFGSLTPVRAMMASRKFHEVFMKIQFLTKPVIAAINGLALGGGLELALSADFRIASKSAEIGQPEISLGLIPGGGGTQRLSRLSRRGLELILTGRRVKADEAQNLGIIDVVTEPEEVEAEVRRLGNAIAEKSPLAVASAKLSYRIGEETNIWAGASLESSLFGLLFSTKDFEEGVRAFLERRKPNFRGE
ncbi:3-hydroxyacyl-CoA dehydrogenase/enoyl-CoA hydratase family protein [Metallosphaera hakonensis]|nr:3-hydroxyacyl-CoA dehydrogenase/enoyl-CoA hydratase family protein [Metallosphaera hakonensis]